MLLCVRIRAFEGLSAQLIMEMKSTIGKSVCEKSFIAALADKNMDQTASAPFFSIFLWDLHETCLLEKTRKIFEPHKFALN